MICDLCLMRGDGATLEAVSPALPLESHGRALVEYLRDPSTDASLRGGITLRYLAMLRLSHHLVVRGEIASSLRLFRQIASEDPHFGEQPGILLEILGCGTSDPEGLATLRRHLSASPVPLGLWDQAAGALSTPGGRAHFATFMKEARAALPSVRDRAVLDLAEALHASRSGDWAGAVYRGEASPERNPAILEILTRPLWYRALGLPHPEIPRDSISLPGSPPERQYLESCRRGDFGAAADLAFEMFDQARPGAVWPLALAWHHRLSATADPARARRVELAVMGAARHLFIRRELRKGSG